MRGGSSEEMSSTCVQGNTPCSIYEQCLSRINQNVTTWQFHQPIIPKMEPIEVKMESDIKTNSNEYYTNTIPRTSNSPVEYRRNPSNFMYTNVPLTPPDSDHMVSPNLHHNSPAQSTESTSISSTYHQTNVSSPSFSASSTLSPSTSYQTSRLSPATSTPVTYQNPNIPQTYSPQRVQSGSPSPNELTNNPLQNLQKSFESSEFLSSPRRNSTGSNDETKIQNPDEDIRKPKVNSNGKVKVHKCKQCKFVAQTKQDFWDHQRIHIKPEKLLTCPKCPFVTEFKHHLEYHILNHSGSKPFKCDQCDYRCVNKSMLSSHMKCHSDIHQYRCMDCNYTSKYCHSLKLHLRKYQHYPDKVLNPDGSVNPFIVIDVEGTRRGPKMKQSKHMHVNQSQINQPQMGPMLPYPMQPQFMFNPSQFPFPFPLLNNLQVQNPLLLQNLQQLVKEQQSRLTAEQPMIQDEASNSRSSPELPESEALDLSVSNHSDREVKPKNRRKGVAFKLNNIQANSDDDSDEETTTMFSNVEVVQSEDADGKTSPMEEESRNSDGSPNNDSNNNNNKSKSSDFVCQYCGINYTDAVLYTIHMGYHGFQNPFTCNMCGAQCGDKISFTLHIAREPHL